MYYIYICIYIYIYIYIYIIHFILPNLHNRQIIIINLDVLYYLRNIRKTYLCHLSKSFWWPTTVTKGEVITSPQRTKNASHGPKVTQMKDLQSSQIYFFRFSTKEKSFWVYWENKKNIKILLASWFLWLIIGLASAGLMT